MKITSYHPAGIRQKLSFTLLLLAIFSQVAWSQEKRGLIDSALLPALQMHYLPEYTFDQPVNQQAWQTQKSGLHVSFGSSERSYFRREVPIQNEQLSWDATGWKGERLNAQILIWSPDTLPQVHFAISELVNGKGKVIDSKNIQLQLVNYVVSNYPYGAKDAVCGETPYKNGYLMPDRLEAFDRFDLPGQTVRPVWLSLNLPASAEPGIYTGKIVATTGKLSVDLQLKITVQNQLLPPPHDWTYRLDLWQNPWVVAWKNHLKPWSEEHKALLKKHLQLYADAGGKYITTYCVHSPWADNSYMI
ncbi:MAG TPA: glycoside hydrolase domain-containing protein, partial [Flavisolibacter sp.]|nr:glycoside hydrolase domain-containing protein [Flavisolibacter sp.]